MKKVASPAGLALFAAAFMLTACNPEEQDRPLDFTPGVYKGQEDQPVSQEAKEKFYQRTLLQGG